MILYLDTSALVKKYVREPGSAETAQAIDAARAVGTVDVARAEFAAAIAKAVRVGILSEKDAKACTDAFRREQASYYLVKVTAGVVTRAATLVEAFPLRAYDAVHLAAASIWQEDLGDPVTFAAFDLNLWEAAVGAGLRAWPQDLPRLLREWKRKQHS